MELRWTEQAATDLELETQITNVGNDDVYLYGWSLCWNFARWLVMNVFDVKGPMCARISWLTVCLHLHDRVMCISLLKSSSEGFRELSTHFQSGNW